MKTEGNRERIPKNKNGGMTIKKNNNKIDILN